MESSERNLSLQKTGINENEEIKSFFDSSKEFYNRMNFPVNDIEISNEGHKLELTIQPGVEAQGYESIAHGGYVALALDTGNVVALNYAKMFGKLPLNVHFEIDFKRPMNLNHRYKLTAEFEEIEEGRKANVNSKIEDEEQNLIASSTSLILLSEKTPETT